MKDILAKKLYTRKSIKKTEDKFKKLGLNNTVNTISFLNVRLITTALLFVILIVFLDYGYIYAPLFSILYYEALYYFVVDYRIKKRTRKLEIEAQHFFEVLTLAFDAGKNLKNALEITVKNVNSELSREFRKTLEETNYSKPLDEALKDMRKRIPSENINSIILNISEANIYGGDISDTLSNQIEYLSQKRYQSIKEDIAKIPMKISIISVLFFIPLMLLLILSPVILQVLS